MTKELKDVLKDYSLSPVLGVEDIEDRNIKLKLLVNGEICEEYGVDLDGNINLKDFPEITTEMLRVLLEQQKQESEDFTITTKSPEFSLSSEVHKTIVVGGGEEIDLCYLKPLTGYQGIFRFESMNRKLHIRKIELVELLKFADAIINDNTNFGENEDILVVFPESILDGTNPHDVFKLERDFWGRFCSPNNHEFLFWKESKETLTILNVYADRSFPNTVEVSVESLIKAYDTLINADEDEFDVDYDNLLGEDLSTELQITFPDSIMVSISKHGWGQLDLHNEELKALIDLEYGTLKNPDASNLVELFSDDGAGVSTTEINDLLKTPSVKEWDPARKRSLGKKLPDFATSPSPRRLKIIDMDTGEPISKVKPPSARKLKITVMEEKDLT